LYSFDDVNPFVKTRFVVNTGESARQEMRSNIYGSIMRRWSKTSSGFFGQVVMGYEGDGTTKSFQMNFPRNINIQHWD
jgi:hypothetical protein